MAARALSGDDRSSTTAAASIDPLPAKIRASADTASTGPADHDAGERDDGQEQVVEALVESQLLGRQRLLSVMPNVARVRADVHVSDSITQM